MRRPPCGAALTGRQRTKNAQLGHDLESEAGMMETLNSTLQTGSKEATMRRKNIISLVIVVSLILTVSAALAGPWKGWRGSGGWGMGSQYNRMYNPATVETISGTVEAVDKVTPMKGMNSGIHVMLKTDKETIAIHLGPEWYVERLDTKIEKGDQIEVKGSRVTFAGKPAVIAAEVRKGDSALVLRDNAGIPAWAGWRR
jgi:hypothetical protein